MSERKTTRSIVTTILLAMFVCVLSVSALIVVFQAKGSLAQVRDALNEQRLNNASVLAQQLGKPVRQNRVRLVSDILTPLIKEESDTRQAVLAVDAKGTVVEFIHVQSFQDGSKAALLKRLKTISMQNEPSLIREGYTNTIIMPIPSERNPKEIVGGLAMVFNDQLVEERAQKAVVEHSIYAFIFALVALALIWFLLRKTLAQPLERTVDVIRKLREKDFEVDIPYAERSDEIGGIARSLLSFRENGRDMEVMAYKQNELERTTLAEKKRVMNEMALAFDENVNKAIQELIQNIEMLRNEAESVHDEAEQLLARNQQVSEASDQTTLKVQSASQATDHLLQAVNEISHQIELSSTIAKNGLDKSEQTNKIVNEMSGAANEVGSVVQLIKDIAEQTNLLALNATIEAARAGDAGKGFAVVANEVKILAQQTAQATEDITSRIKAIQNVSGEAVLSINEIHAIVSDIHKNSELVAVSVQEQTLSTHEIAQNTQEAADSTQLVSRDVETMHSGSQNVENLATKMAKNASQVQAQLVQLAEQAQLFLNGIRKN